MLLSITRWSGEARFAPTMKMQTPMQTKFCVEANCMVIYPDLFNFIVQDKKPVTPCEVGGRLFL
jgi:hypothetical protein